MKMKHAFISFNVKSDKSFQVKQDMSDAGEFFGHGSVFKNVDFGGDVVEPGAFEKTLRAWQEKRQWPQMLWGHEHNNLVGDWLDMKEDDFGLAVHGKLWKDTEQAKVARNTLIGTGPKGLSIGYSVEKQENLIIDGQNINRLIELKLFELSIAPFAMNELAMVTQAKGLFIDGKVDKRFLEKELRGMGFSIKQAKAFISEGANSLRDEVKEDDDRDGRSFLDSIKKLSLQLTGEQDGIKRGHGSN